VGSRLPAGLGVGLLLLQLLDARLRRRDLVAVLAVGLQPVARHLALVELAAGLGDVAPAPDGAA